MRKAESCFRFAVLFTASALASVVTASTSSLEQLAWLAGCWSSENAEAGSGEQWMRLAGGTMLGMSRTVRDGRTVAYEFMRIDSTANGKHAFFAQPSGQPPATFPLLSLTTTEVVFSNPEHDFPQRIVYRFEPPARLRARIEGMSNGVRRVMEFPMKREGCEP